MKEPKEPNKQQVNAQNEPNELKKQQIKESDWPNKPYQRQTKRFNKPNNKPSISFQHVFFVLRDSRNIQHNATFHSEKTKTFHRVLDPGPGSDFP
jgi:ABC-type transport system involved in Fe-S cluster assembly fused permease/ATPase subunit